MSVAIIQERLLTYRSQTVLEQENALKEIVQEIALMVLSRAGFFRKTAFQGGTCLRILYGLERFSEDLDFVLMQPDPKFDWRQYIENMREEFSAYGFNLEVEDRKKADRVVKTAFLKADSEGGVMIIKDLRSNRRKLKIKLEIDTHPPAGSQYELKYLDFPLAFSIKTQNLPSLFAGKCHALLCRNYIKGRDWYDFSWYIAKQTTVNLTLLRHAIEQLSPWKNQSIHVTSQWLLEQLENKIITMDWKVVQQDVIRFLHSKDIATVELWSKDFFLARLEKLANYLKD